MPERCKYYDGGYCQNSPCKFFHDPNIPSIPCKHFVAGNCRNGDKCAYFHEGAKDALNETDADREARINERACPEPPADAEICRYDPNCYRLNPEHLAKYRHPSREKLPPPPPVREGKSRYDWETIKRSFPCDRSPSQAEERKKLFKIMDFNGNGLISLAELDKCVIESMGLGDVVPKKVQLRAFYFAHKVDKGKGDDFVTWSEFRVLMCAMRRYLECFEVFDMIDSAIERDGRITTQELEKSVGLLKDMGLPKEAIDKFMASTLKPPMKTMACAVAAQNHMVLFEEFCNHYALRYDLNLQPGDGFGRLFHGARPVKRWGEF